MPSNFNYQEIYNKLYKSGYHADLQYTHAESLCNYLESLFSFSSLLDIGCSHGYVLRRFENVRACGVDVSDLAVQRCKEQQLNAYLANATNLKIFADREFDIVLSTDCFEHLHPKDADSAISEAVRLANVAIAMKISTVKDSAKWKHIVGHDLHLTVRPLNWWTNKFHLEIKKQSKDYERLLLIDSDMFIFELT